MKFLHSVKKRTACLMISFFCLSFAAPGAPVLAREGMHQDYTLEKVVIFSRHNLRSPISTDNEKRNALTPHHWQKGEGNPGGPLQAGRDSGDHDGTVYERLFQRRAF